MVINSYQALKSFIEEKRPNKPRLLLHACCAPCSSYVLEFLKSSFEITIYFYNPNIDSLAEYEKRFNEFSKLGNYSIIKADYNPKAFSDIAKGLEDIPEGGKRCWACYEERLESSAIIAREGNFDYFTTTLSISPYKNADRINEIGDNLAKIYDVKFLYSNFKKDDGYKKSIALSKQYGLYRQDYCGCIFSFNEKQLRDALKNN